MEIFTLPPSNGRIEVICGCMFSGKTEELIRRLRRALIAKQRVKIFKPAIDVRYDDKAVVTHTGVSIPSIPINSPMQILQQGTDAHVVGIDEAQFFDESVVEVAIRLANRGIRVVIAGLDMDYTGKPFGPMPQLLCVAEYVTKLHAICARTGQPAHFSHRLSASDETVLLGEGDAYQPLSRDAFISALREKNMSGNMTAS